MDDSVCRLVVVEDNEADLYLIRIALERAKLRFEWKVCADGGAAFDYLQDLDSTETPAPDLLLLDLNLPQYSGEEILERARRSGKCAGTPVIVMTSSASPNERAHVEAMGATFFAKPSNLGEFLMLADLIRAQLQGRAATDGDRGAG